MTGLLRVQEFFAEFKWFINICLLLEQISTSVYRVDNGKFYQVQVEVGIDVSIKR